MAGQIQGFYTQIQKLSSNSDFERNAGRTRSNLEAILLSRNPGRIGNTQGAYGAVYGVVPTPQNAPPPVRDRSI